MKGQNTKLRNKIITKAKQLIKLEVLDFDSKLVGEQETILDQYIEKVCIELGWSLADFYNEQGKVLRRLLI